MRQAARPPARARAFTGILAFSIASIAAAVAVGATPVASASTESAEAAESVGSTGATKTRVALVPKALPGAEPFSPALRKQLASALESRPESYRPRTRNLHESGAPLYSNRLLLESSPYLQQHAHNPVNWHPWGDEAFETAKRLERPVLVSIGYSTCHWCHVMEEESFDDPETATFLNQHYIAIKVDREARPDIDAIYMAAIHAMRGRGGWPLNVWVTPDREPFYAGTYFPPTTRGDQMSFREVLARIATQYREAPEDFRVRAEKLEQAIRADLGSRSPIESRAPTPAILDAAMRRTATFVDRKWGGARQRIKFPSSVPLRFLLRYAHRKGDEEALELALLTLRKMAAGGIYDHVGGGFHRYSTDERWLVPHFEKMLYDNAQLAVAYLEAGHLTGEEAFTRIARETLDYLAREMLSPEGAFFSATDADSPTPSGESEEGWFFTWTPAEIDRVLTPKNARATRAYYDVTASGHLDGRSILHSWRSAADVAADLEIEVSELEGRLRESREQLYQTRLERPPPLRDDKIIVAWNGLAISAFARAGLTLGEDRYTRIAERAAAFFLEHARAPDGRLRRIHQAGRSSGPAFLEDYAFLIAGLLDLYEAQSESRWLQGALELQGVLDAHYADEEAGGYFQTADDQRHLIVREKPNSDGALPSGNSVAALNLLRLSEFTGDYVHEERASRLFSALSDVLDRSPSASSELLVAVDFLLSDRVELILIRPQSQAGTSEMLGVARAKFLPNRVFSSVVADDDLARHAKFNSLLAEREPIGDKTTAYLCKNRNCNFPTNDPSVLRKQLDALRKVK